MLRSPTGAGATTLERRTLLVREATPDSILLVGVHGELEARLRHGAALAYGLGARLSGLLLEFGLSLVGAEEQCVVIFSTGGLFLPVELLNGIHHGDGDLLSDAVKRLATVASVVSSRQ